MSVIAQTAHRHDLLPASDVTGGACLHCGQSLAASSAGNFCCRGCETVYALLRGDDLGRYYQLRGTSGLPAMDVPRADRDLSWLAEAAQPDSTAQLRHLQLDVQGIHCSGCVWILEKTFRKHGGARKIIVNPALGSAELWIASDFPLEAWIRSVERYGYRFGPRLKTGNARSDALLMRLGICIALALNVMLLAAALYLGLDEGRLYAFVRNLSYGLATLSVLVGAPVFFRAAWAGLRIKVLHLDVPISLGIALAYLGSSWAFWTGSDRALYLDSVSVFIALMLLGRYLQERVLIANRQRLLANDGTAGLRSKRVEGGRIETVKSTALRAGDHLLIAPGDLVPIDATLQSPRASISMEWIRGESRQSQVDEGQIVPAGAFNVGASALRVRCVADFASSPLQALLRGGSAQVDGKAEPEAHHSGLAQAIASYYVAAVLLAAGLGFFGWIFHSGSVPRALEVATAILVVTCPCAFGIASPLAHEIVQSRLRRVGLYLRSGDFLSRAGRIKTIVFDKTGTLTTGSMQLVNPDAIAALSADERDILYALSSKSSHPSSMAIFAALTPYGLRDHLAVTVEEVAGMGLHCQIEGTEYRLGRAQWATSAGEAAQTTFAREGRELARFTLTEELRSDASEVISALQRDGYQTYILSGDSLDRVQDLARSIGVPTSRALATCSPEEKRRWLETHDHGDLLFLGDGINDSLAAQQASFSGTPALDRPFMASHCDFYLATERLAPMRLALKAAARLATVIRRNLYFALAYNVLAIGLAWAGLMQPWLAALLMPTSSILVVLATTYSLSRARLSWTS